MTITTDPTARSASPAAAAGARHTTAILAIILISYFMILLDNSIIFTALPKIHAAMRFSPAGLAWVQDAYTLVFGGLLLLGAGAGDLLGRRRVFVFGLSGLILPADPNARHASGQSRRAKREPRSLAEPADVAS